MSDAEELRKLAEWAYKLGASRIKVGNAEIEFREPTAEEIARDPYLKLTEDETGLVEEITESQRQHEAKRNIEKLLYHSA